jgi:predicted transcriptional regulator of viral defense system
MFGRGLRTTTVAEASDALDVSSAEAARRLAAWASRGWLRRIRRGLYLAVPVDAPNPLTWTEDPWYLADLVWHPCYITGWSAANHWSLTDQVFRSTVVATTARIRQVEQVLAGNSYLVHHVSDSRLGWGLRSEWRHERRCLVADPAHTVAEMLTANHYSSPAPLPPPPTSVLRPPPPARPNAGAAVTRKRPGSHDN